MQHRQALAQVILTNKKQTAILSRVALIYKDSAQNDNLELIDCSDNSVMYNNDINWNAERASSPTKDAIDRINDRIKGKTTLFQNGEIKEFYVRLKKTGETVIAITEKNFNVVYNQWKNEVTFTDEIADEQKLINLFLVDILNGTNYKQRVKTDETEFAFSKEMEQPLIREGTNLSKYERFSDGEKIRIIYDDKICYTIRGKEKYDFF